MGPIIILDKSAIQSLSRDEIFFLFKHYYVNVPPILLIEILADLKKKSKGSMSEKEVTILANKLLTLDSQINVYYKDLCLGSLCGAKVLMTGQILIRDGEVLQTKTGDNFLYVDEPAERKVLRNWQNGVFDDSEILLAERWRESIKKIDLELYKHKLKGMLGNIENKISDFNDLGVFVDNVLSKPDPRLQLSYIDFIVADIQIPQENQTHIYNRWLNSGLKMLSSFAPYAYFYLKAKLIFIVGMANGMITTRATNIIDLEYLFYLPFCMVFTSGDKFHKSMTVALLRDDQSFIESELLKIDLHWLADEWSKLSEEEKINRHYDLGSYPPENAESITHKLWIKHMRPRTAHSGNLRHTKESEQKLLEQLKPFMDAIDEYNKPN